MTSSTRFLTALLTTLLFAGTAAARQDTLTLSRARCVEIALSEVAIHLTEEQLEQQAEMMMQAALDGTMTMITPNLAEFSGEAVLTGGAAMEGGTVDLVL